MVAWAWRAVLLVCVAATAWCEFSLFAPLDHPAVEYTTGQMTDPVALLNQKLKAGEVQLPFQGVSGYLRSVLNELQVPVESQLLVFSKTSLQARFIGPKNPRSLFFNDAVVVAWVRGEPFIEVAAQDPRQGVSFYTLNQIPTEKPQFTRHARQDQGCLHCHDIGVPGLLVRSVFSADDGKPLPQYGDYNTDHRSPFAERWGGWYVTGKPGGLAHMGNSVVAPGAALDSLTHQFDTSAYLSPYSDIVALMVFDHQMRMANLLTAVGWQYRIASYEKRTLASDGIDALVDCLLFIDEAPLPGPVRGSSGFAEKFSAAGPRDGQGRSLRTLDLNTRLMRFPCSYMIYSAAFDALPAAAQEAAYQKLWQVLSGSDRDKKYARLSLAGRKAIVEILRETKAGLPDYFKSIR